MLTEDVTLKNQPLPALLHALMPYLEDMMVLDPFERPSFAALIAKDPLRDLSDQTVVDLACTALAAVERACYKSFNDPQVYFSQYLKESRDSTAKSGSAVDTETLFFFLDREMSTHFRMLLCCIFVA
jgi:hypothetical protein